MLERMSYQHLDQVVAIHESSWSNYETSVKLGRVFLHLFYSNVINSEYSFGYVYVFDGKVIAYAIGFYDYQGFSKWALRRIGYRIGIIALKRMLLGKIRLSDIVNLLIDERKLRKTRFPKYHLGALALSNEYKGTSHGGNAIKEAIVEVLERLKDKNCPGCSVSCDVRNMAMRKYLLKMGFKEVSTTHFFGKSVVLFEKSFNYLKTIRE